MPEFFYQLVNGNFFSDLRSGDEKKSSENDQGVAEMDLFMKV